jgi:NADPH:quinone reductase-like Zn-dependent oxidoreductase
LGERYNTILDMADLHSLAERRAVLAPGGTLIPNSGRGGRVFGSVGRIVGAWVVSPFVSHRLKPFLSVTKRHDLMTLAEMIELGDVAPVVGSTHPLSAAGAAISEAGSGHARGKVVLSLPASSG